MDELELRVKRMIESMHLLKNQMQETQKKAMPFSDRQVTFMKDLSNLKWHQLVEKVDSMKEQAITDVVESNLTMGLYSVDDVQRAVRISNKAK